MTRKTTIFFTYLLFCLNLFGQNNGRPIKLIVSSLIEAAKIKNFNYDKKYKYTIIAKEINDGYYKYQYLSTINKTPIADDKPNPDPLITLTIQQSTPCIDNSGEECLLVKRSDRSKTETVRIKGFNYDERYICTIVVTELKNSTYNYNYVRTINCEKKPEEKEDYPITIEEDGLDDDDYIRYMKEGETILTYLPKKYYKGPELKPNIRYVLIVKEDVVSDQTFIKFVEQLEPTTKESKKIEIIVSGLVQCNDDKNGECLLFKRIDNNKTENTRIKNFNYDTNFIYNIYINEINESIYKYEYVSIIKRELKPTQPCPIPQPAPFKCNNIEDTIPTCNELIYTQYYLNTDGSIDIRPVNYHTTDFYKFFGKICGFTFEEDHKYTLEVKMDGDNYQLINVLCNTKMNFIQNPSKIEFDCSEVGGSSENPPPKDTIKKEDPKPKPTYKITELDSGVWYLRYLFQADSLIPINNLSDTSYYLNTDTWRNKINIFTPCNFYFDKLSTDEPKKFVFESLTVSLKKCDATTNLLFEQLDKINHYEIIDNKLKLSVYNNDLQDAKVLIVLEGVPKKK